jgi:hypothetical protein
MRILELEGIGIRARVEERSAGVILASSSGVKARQK